MAPHIHNADSVDIEHQVTQPPAPPLPPAAVQPPGEPSLAALQPAHADGAQELDQPREQVAELEEELTALHQQLDEREADIAGLQHRANARGGRILALQRQAAERDRRENLERQVDAQQQELEWEDARIHNAACRPHEILRAPNGEIPANLPHTRWGPQRNQKAVRRLNLREDGIYTE